MSEVIECVSPSEFDVLGTEWNDLLRESTSDCFFLTWEWLHTWWTHLAGNRSLSVLKLYRDGNLAGIAPLVRKPLMVPLSSGQLEFLGSGTAGSDYLDFIIRRGHEADALAALERYFDSANCLLRLSQIRHGSGVVADLARHCRQRGWKLWESKINVCPSINLAGHTFDSYLGTLGSEHRYNFRRKLKALTRRFDVQLHLACSEEERQESLNHLVALHTMRWRERGGSDAFFLPEHVAFHDELSALTLRRGWLRLFTLRLDGKAAASLYGFRYGRVFYFYQSGFDPAYSSHSLGLILMGMAIRHAVEEGAEEYDMLHGAESYKFHWAHELRELGTMELYPPGAAGWAWNALRSSVRSGKRLVRNVLPQHMADKIAALRKPKPGKDLHAASPAQDGQLPCLTMDRH